MSDSQLSLFPNLPQPTPKADRIRPWRKTLIDVWGPKASPAPEKIEAGCIDLIRRDRELFHAMMLHGFTQEAPEIQDMLEIEGNIVGYLLLLRRDELSPKDIPEAVATIRRVALHLEGMRHEMILALDPERRGKILAAESRTRINDHFEIYHPLAELELQLAEERGELMTIEISNDGLLPPGFLTEADVDRLMGDSLNQWRTEQDQRPLPPRGGLRALLKGIPAIWLDVICEFLDIAADKGSLRKDREMEIAKRIVDPARLERILEGLGREGCALLRHVLEKGGQCETGPLLRRFGSDADDGWFWNEVPPTSIIGRCRLRGLIFIGRLQGRKTALIPKELREPLQALLEAGP